MPLRLPAIVLAECHLAVPAKVVSILGIVVYALKLQCLKHHSFSDALASFHLQLKLIEGSCCDQITASDDLMQHIYPLRRCNLSRIYTYHIRAWQMLAWRTCYPAVADSKQY